MRSPRQSGNRSRRVTIWLAIIICLLPPALHHETVQASTIAQVPANEVSIGVLGLFHPREFVIRAIPGQALMLRAGSATEILEASVWPEASVRKESERVLVRVGTRVFDCPEISLSGRQGEPVRFRLAIPGKISRRYLGRLEIRPSGRELIAIVHMDREAAVAAVVAAENLPDTPIEAFKAQAIAARSYLVSGRGRHAEFDFCDTTHCQFMREPPDPASNAAQAVTATKGLALAYNSQPFPAMYTRSCTGRTVTPLEVGMHPGSYPYYSVECRYCREHPARWTTHLSSSDAALLRVRDESSRLELGRRLGWNAVPSSQFKMLKHGDQILLRGSGQGHGIGLCQAGAKAMALEGASYQQILSHYYPNTTIIALPSS